MLKKAYKSVKRAAGYLFLLLIYRLVNLLSFETAAAAGSYVGRMISFIPTRDRSTAFQNLTLAFPEKKKMISG